MVDNQSKYDPSRPTVGNIYRNAAINNKQSSIECGDLTHEIMKSLCDDLNEAIHLQPFGEQPFYIQVSEKNNELMPRAIERTLRHRLKRPYPEDDTIVFWSNLKENEIRFCWCLPHFSYMRNMLENQTLYDAEMIGDIKAWLMQDLKHFGFTHDENGNLCANPHFKDRPMKYHTNIINPCFN